MGMFVLSRATADSGYGLVAVALAIIGISIAFAMIPSLDAILGALSAGETGAGSALTRAIQNVGASFGVAVMGSILNSSYQAQIRSELIGLPAPMRSAAETGVAVAAAAARHLPPPLGSQLLHAAQVAYSQGMSDVLLVTGGITVAGAVLMALFLPARAARPAPEGELAMTTVA
jgi:hypothetical protein